MTFLQMPSWKTEKFHRIPETWRMASTVRMSSRGNVIYVYVNMMIGVLKMTIKRPLVELRGTETVNRDFTVMVKFRTAVWRSCPASCRITNRKYYRLKEVMFDALMNRK